jgi:hypothetical protein
VICGTPEDLLRHAKDCLLIPGDVRAQAGRDFAARKAKARAKSRRGADPAPLPGPPSSPPSLPAPSPAKAPRTNAWGSDQKPALFDQVHMLSDHVGPSGLLDTSSYASDDEQAEFCRDILELLISGNVAFRAVDLPRWIAFFKKYTPRFTLPGSKSLRATHLNRAYDRVLDTWKSEFQGQFASVQMDGMKSRSKRALIGSHISVQYKASLVKMTLYIRLTSSSSTTS